MQSRSEVKRDEKEREISKEDNEAIKDIEKTVKIDHVDEVFELGFENWMAVEKETIISYQDLTEMDDCDRIELGLKEEIASGKTLEKNKCETLAEDNDNKIKNPVEVIETLNISGCYQDKIRVGKEYDYRKFAKIDEKKDDPNRQSNLQEDQFKESRVRSVNISIENDRTILVNKVDNEDENKKIDIDDLSKLDKEVIRNIEYTKKGEVVTSEVGECINIIESVDNEIVDMLFNPRGRVEPIVLYGP
ncbi:hypothetical protein F8M41_000394 [Gigaspora margarita]|uniref:Uncharacterized protein n=1 Tax=Gigaspora margarita TaxID=4874 RepID=A0A8H4A9W8_GIGMA|nr:hypothetical protein F8M41_000394 [Gigaspora margarita]